MRRHIQRADEVAGQEAIQSVCQGNVFGIGDGLDQSAQEGQGLLDRQGLRVIALQGICDFGQALHGFADVARASSCSSSCRVLILKNARGSSPGWSKRTTVLR